jgi:hypothetical protein
VASSTQLAPALTMSSRIAATLVACRPLRIFAEIGTQPAWQMKAIGLPADVADWHSASRIDSRWQAGCLRSWFPLNRVAAVGMAVAPVSRVVGAARSGTAECEGGQAVGAHDVALVSGYQCPSEATNGSAASSRCRGDDHSPRPRLVRTVPSRCDPS